VLKGDVKLQLTNSVLCMTVVHNDMHTRVNSSLICVLI